MPEETVPLSELTAAKEQYAALEQETATLRDDLAKATGRGDELAGQIALLKHQISAQANHADGVSRILASLKGAVDTFQDVIQNVENALDAQRDAVRQAEKIAPDKPIDARTL